MSEKDKILEGLLQAMRTESSGHHFYMMAAKTVSDPKGKDVFVQLAEEELMHQRFLKIQYHAFFEHGAADASASLGSRSDYSGDNPIFSEGIRSRMEEAHFEMSALAIGIQLEFTALKYYSAQADQIGDMKAQAFFRELADWESGHYHALLRQQEHLKEDYYSAAGFAPF